MYNLPFTLRQLEIFASLSSTRSFRRTAEVLGISQASVSNQIKTLENQLGMDLFDRKPGRRPTLKPEGLAFLSDLQAFQKAAEGLASHRRDKREPSQSSKRFKILVGQGMFDGYIRPKLDLFIEENPTIELKFEARLPFDELVRAVEGGNCDFALINQRADQPVSHLTQDLALVPGGIYGHRKFAEGYDLPLPNDVINILPFIFPQISSLQERDVMSNYEKHGIQPRKIVGRTGYYDVMAAMLDRGLGLASFSETILPPELRKNVVLLKALEDWRLLYFRKDYGHDPRADLVEEFLTSSVLDDPHYPAIRKCKPAKGTSH